MLETHEHNTKHIRCPVESRHVWKKLERHVCDTHSCNREHELHLSRVVLSIIEETLYGKWHKGYEAGIKERCWRQEVVRLQSSLISETLYGKASLPLKRRS